MSSKLFIFLPQKFLLQMRKFFAVILELSISMELVTLLARCISDVLPPRCARLIHVFCKDMYVSFISAD